MCHPRCFGRWCLNTECMKKLLSASLILFALSLGGCGSDDEPEALYTDAQKEALAMFTGTWADYQFSNLGSYEGAYLQPDPDKIVFTLQYEKPEAISPTYEAQGLCTYYAMPYKGASYEATRCYYNVSPSATVLSLWSVEDNAMFHVYDLKIKSPTEFYLYQSGITLPYIFRKQ